ncbi:hypothetical protein F2P56_016220 [Juglans regia]|uniref:Uncharacterized protein LOC108982874 n=2 Tax=Juglans regia TaxID=51240 RepID=A0A2I4DRW3_JUGRE|nr:uncharacterized protein LOC108982874 [Juglans regia]KAF5466279.1 hypothetical protein F2P56_016220 [Juglans regia]
MTKPLFYYQYNHSLKNNKLLLLPLSSCTRRSMAVACSSSPHIPILKSGLVINPISKSLVVKYSQAPLKKAPRFQIKCSIRNKVFEDRSNGIICYRDDSGEIICEGYDDGPRFQQHTPRTACHPRDVEIFDLLLQQSRLQMVKGSGLNHADESVAVQKDFNCNGFNSFC